MMFELRYKSIGFGQTLIAVLLLLVFMAAMPFTASADSKKKQQADAAAAKPTPIIDYSNIVWPNTPAVARIRYLAFYSAQKLSQV